MLKVFFLIQAFLISGFCYSATIAPDSILRIHSVTVNTPISDSLLTMLINLTPQEYKRITGEKLSIKGILGLRIMQAKLKKESRKGDLADLSLNKDEPKKKPKLLIALLIVLGLSLLVLGILFLIASGIEWQ